MQSKAVIRLPAVQQKTNLSRSTIYRLESQGKFPSRVLLGENSVGWYLEEIDNFLANLPRAVQRKTAS
ncbi:transcriptional regulator, AlpA family [Nitrosospira sp. Nsp11]|uniref:helix-turn-helix transcriptional regulator n=1 Tax=Nitrosospira sp. Nsp11 TaxID=1855338 RepID=UPI000923E65A|nr:AlpA family phage regulatory protein [Nitrosospira sp. Nsp11]SHM20141.1 transcriptional regulator, AlpA family [Nitrosospira sp. Nsp11]